MADKKISALTAAGALDGTEIIPIVQAAATRRTTAAAIAALAGGGASWEIIDSAFAEDFGSGSFITFAALTLQTGDFLKIELAFNALSSGSFISLDAQVGGNTIGSFVGDSTSTTKIRASWLAYIQDGDNLSIRAVHEAVGNNRFQGISEPAIAGATSTTPGGSGANQIITLEIGSSPTSPWAFALLSRFRP